jgi:acetyl-CoA carboxylase biotin carboxyl carrier protein
MNIKELKEIMEIFENSRITEMDLERQGVRISLKKSAPDTAAEIRLEPADAEGVSVEPGSGEEAEAGRHEGALEIRTPMVGTFYRTPAPDSEPFVEEGDIINEGDIICIIEAMKLMNEIKSEISGKVLKVLVENGQAVEFNQPLFLIEAE